jgi:hypothetical protein
VIITAPIDFDLTHKAMPAEEGAPTNDQPTSVRRGAAANNFVLNP